MTNPSAAAAADPEAGHQPRDFPIPASELIRVVADRDRDWIHQQGGVASLAKALHSDVNAGVSSDEVNASLQPRIGAYGENKFKYPPPKSFLSLVLAAFKDVTIIILCIAAVVSLAIGLAIPKKRAEYSYLEGIAIVIVVVIVVLVQAVIDRQKEKKFRQLNSVKDQYEVQVRRGNTATAMTADLLVVGDVITITAGDKLPADAIFIDGSGLKTNEAAMTGEPIDIEKNIHDDMFLLSGTSVSEGVATVLVVAVGERSQWGVILKSLIVEPEDTPLQERLDRLAVNIGKLGIIFAVLTFLVSLLRWVIDGASSGEWDGTRVLDFFIDAVTIVVVAIPEGLPLAITLGLAFAMRKMMRDNNLVRRLEACETMGSATQLNADKTGTLTQNRMTVVEALWAGKRVAYEGAMNDPSIDAFLSPSFRSTVCLSISVNTQANLQFTSGGLIDHLGNKTECALLQHVHKWGVDYRDLRREHPPAHIYMFDSNKKRMSTAEDVGGDAARLYTKGAPDILIHICDDQLEADGVTRTPLSDATRASVMREVEDMAGRGLRTLLLAVRDVPHRVTDDDFWSQPPDSNLTLVGVVGIKDPIRPETKEAVRQLKSAGVTVRMVTGDNALTARYIAREAGILDDDGVVMEGPEFRALTDNQLDKVALRIQVLARSTPSDKLVLVRKLKMLGEVTSVTGDGTNGAFSRVSRDCHSCFCAAATWWCDSTLVDSTLGVYVADD